MSNHRPSVDRRQGNGAKVVLWLLGIAVALILVWILGLLFLLHVVGSGIEGSHNVKLAG